MGNSGETSYRDLSQRRQPQNGRHENSNLVSSIWDSRITDANQTTGDNFFGPGGGPADLFLIRDTQSGNIPVRQLEAIQTNGTATVFGTVGTNQNFVGSGDFNSDGLSDLLINVDNPAAATRTFLVDQMNPGGIQAQFQIAVRGADWVVDANADFNHNGTSDILVHRDTGGQRTLEVSVMNNNTVQSNVTINVNGTKWDVDGTGDFNGDGTPDIRPIPSVGGLENAHDESICLVDVPERP